MIGFQLQIWTALLFVLSPMLSMGQSPPIDRSIAITDENGTNEFVISRIFPDRVEVQRDQFKFFFNKSDVKKAENPGAKELVQSGQMALAHVAEQDLQKFPALLQETIALKSRVELALGVFGWLIPELEDLDRQTGEAIQNLQRTLQVVHICESRIESIEKVARSTEPVDATWTQVFKDSMEQAGTIPFEKIRHDLTAQISEKQAAIETEWVRNTRYHSLRTEDLLAEIKKGIEEGSLTPQKWSSFLTQVERSIQRIPVLDVRTDYQSRLDALVQIRQTPVFQENPTPGDDEIETTLRSLMETLESGADLPSDRIAMVIELKEKIAQLPPSATQELWLKRLEEFQPLTVESVDEDVSPTETLETSTFLVRESTLEASESTTPVEKASPNGQEHPSQEVTGESGKGWGKNLGILLLAAFSIGAVGFVLRRKKSSDISRTPLPETSSPPPSSQSVVADPPPTVEPQPEHVPVPERSLSSDETESPKSVPASPHAIPSWKGGFGASFGKPSVIPHPPRPETPPESETPPLEEEAVHESPSPSANLGGGNEESAPGPDWPQEPEELVVEAGSPASSPMEAHVSEEVWPIDEEEPSRSEIAFEPIPESEILPEKLEVELSPSLRWEEESLTPPSLESVHDPEGEPEVPPSQELTSEIEAAPVLAEPPPSTETEVTERKREPLVIGPPDELEDWVANRLLDLSALPSDATIWMGDQETSLREGVRLSTELPKALYPLGQRIGLVSESREGLRFSLLDKDAEGDWVLASIFLLHEGVLDCFSQSGSRAVWVMGPEGVTSCELEGSQLKTVGGFGFRGAPTSSNELEWGSHRYRPIWCGEDFLILPDAEGGLHGVAISRRGDEHLLKEAWHFPETPPENRIVSNIVPVAGKIAAIDHNGCPMLIDPSGGTPAQIHRSATSAANLSSDGERVIFIDSASEKGPVLVLYEFSRGEIIATTPLPPGADNLEMWTLEDGVIVRSGNQVFYFDNDDLSERWDHSLESESAKLLHHDSTQILLIVDDRTLRVLGRNSGVNLWEIEAQNFGFQRIAGALIDEGRILIWGETLKGDALLKMIE